MKKIILFSLVVFACLSCKKNEKKCDSKYNDYSSDSPVDSTLLKYFLVNQGSYWVYEDEFNGGEDSVYVLSSGQKKIGTQSKSGPGCADITSISLNSAYVNLSGTTSPTSYTLTGNSMYLEGTMFNYHTVFLKVENSEMKADSIVYYPSIAIDGTTTYTDVYKIKITDSYYGGKVSKKSYFYINDSIGIVRKDLYQTDGSYHRYYLKRYSIVK